MKTIAAAERILHSNDWARAFEAQCLQALSRREHSRSELLAKKPADCDAATAEAVLDELAARGWQSDARYCDSYVRSKASSGNGAGKIRQALKHSGVAKDLIDAALETQDWFAIAAEVYAKKYFAPTKLAAERAKRQRFMVQRGFSFAEIRHAEEMLAEAAEAEDD